MSKFGHKIRLILADGVLFDDLCAYFFVPNHFIFMKPRLVLDQDDVLAATHAQLADIVFETFGLSYPRELYDQKPYQELLNEADQKRLFKQIFEPGFFVNIPVMADAQTIVKELTQKYDVFVATAAMEFPNSFREKYDWLKTHFDFIPWKNIVFCGSKNILRADILIDDMAYNLEAFEGRGLLFDAVHNRHITAHERVHNWNEIGNLLL
jgi:5'-nucleotidase